MIRHDPPDLFSNQTLRNKLFLEFVVASCALWFAFEPVEGAYAHVAPLFRHWVLAAM